MSLFAAPIARPPPLPFSPPTAPPFRFPFRLRQSPLLPTFRVSPSAHLTFRAWQPFPPIPPPSAASLVGAIRISPSAPFGAFRSCQTRLSAAAEAGNAGEAESACESVAWVEQEIEGRHSEEGRGERGGTGFRGEGGAEGSEEGGEGESWAEAEEEEGGEEGEEGEGGEARARMAATEESVGISCYANDLPGIHGVLKQRFADFIVNEVAPDGTVVHLTHLHLSPALLAQEQQQQALARRREAESLGEVVDAGALVAQFRQALGGRGGAVGEREGGGGLRDEEDARKLQQLLEGIRGIQLWWRARKGGEEGGGGEGEGAGGGEGDGGDREEGSKQGGEGALGEGEAEGKGLPPAMPEPVVFAASADKAYRAAMHAFFKAFPFLVSDTIDAVEGPPYRCVRLRFLPPPALNLGGAAGRGAAGNGAQRARRDGDGGGEGASKDRDGADDRGGGEGEEEENEQPAFDRRGRKGADGVPATATRRFLMFHVLKENKDTNEAMALVARYLGVQTKALGFSGTKDKRAVTVQRVTVCNQTARKVASLNSKLFGIRVGDYRFVDQPLVLGQLAGNRFIVTLRSVQAPSLDAITAAAEGLRTHGIINYFGLQCRGLEWAQWPHTRWGRRC
ncbi:hypothetical protein CLOP_g21387 [Closterium sp. NIES-67]|nr:hypothetical protein CLOP_g21387 [Closterium sp. NIES-67]